MSTEASSGRPSDPRAAIVAEWVSITDGDLSIAQREFAYTGQRNLRAVCFHSQQAVEKLMKAVLIRRGAKALKTHDLERLDRRLRPVGVAPCAGAADLGRLTAAAAETRYPGSFVPSEEAATLLGIASAIWARLRPLV